MQSLVFPQNFFKVIVENLHLPAETSRVLPSLTRQSRDEPAVGGKTQQTSRLHSDILSHFPVTLAQYQRAVRSLKYMSSGLAVGGDINLQNTAINLLGQELSA